jgi:hypothetical protein
MSSEVETLLLLASVVTIAVFTLQIAAAIKELR